jgi:glycosyltransferase involved in cell wall biosynthesis
VAVVPRVLTLSRNYPNSVQKLLGLWVRQLVVASREICEPRVIAPVPWCPPVPGLPDDFARYRRIARRESDETIEVLRPRFLVGPSSLLAPTEAATYYAGIRREVDRLARSGFKPDLLHAHFTYPDGVAAVLLGRRLRVPVVITEQAPWDGWLEHAPLVRRQAVWAAGNCSAHIAISTSVRRSIERFAGASERLHVIPDAVDGSVFTLPGDDGRRKSNQILFVGVIRHAKGADVLIRAMRILADRGEDVRLVLIGEGHYSAHVQQQADVEALAEELGLNGRVEFAGRKPLAALVAAMQESALLVLPSRAESLGMVLVEALACGTPVVATRCGGPEDIVTDEVGELVPPEDPEALADAISRVLARRGSFEPERLRQHALDRFGHESVVARIADVYDAVLAAPRR